MGYSRVSLVLAAVAGSTLMLIPLAAIAQTDAPAPAVKKVSVKGTARFDFDEANVNVEDGTKLMSEVRSMQNVTWQTIRVTGHTDSIGSDRYNKELSARRADAVRLFLINKGVKPERIKPEGLGKEQPIASNRTAEGRAKNRRAEIEFVGLQALAAN